MTDNYRAGFVGIVGLPNAGKSSLLNDWVNEKISIVNPKPQTTRRRVLGIHNQENAQIVFVDSPGLICADKGLNAFLSAEAQSVMSESDLLLVVLALDMESPESCKALLTEIVKSGKPWIVLFNKTDLGNLSHRQGILRDWIESQLPSLGGVQAPLGFFPVSATKPNKDNQQKIFELIRENLPKAPAPLYDGEIFTTESTRNLCAELVREQCFSNLHQELPYELAVRIHKFEEQGPQFARIEAEIVLAKEKHKAMVIGKGASVLKKIGTDARVEIEKLLGHKCFLALNVKVSPDWYLNRAQMKGLGYVSENH